MIARSRHLVLAALLTSGVAVSACSSGSAAAPSGSSPRAAAGGPKSCTYTKDGRAARSVGLPPVTPVGAAQLTLSLALGTSKAAHPLVIALSPRTAPCTVNSIAYLAGKKYFDNTRCHRLTTAGIFVLQCGDPTGTGAGGPGYRFADELSGSEKYDAGTIAMANAGAGTNGSQFFIVYADSSLPPSYTVFGHVTSGLPTVSQVARAGSDNSNGQGDGAPKLSVTITAATAS